MPNRVDTGLNRGVMLITLIAVVLAVTVLVPGHAIAQIDQRHLDEEGRVRKDSVWIEFLDGDSLWIDSSDVDSLLHVDSLAFEEKRHSAKLANIPSGFHPSYRTDYYKQLSSTTLSHEFKIAYKLTDRMAVSDTTVFTSKEITSANKKTSSRDDRIGLEYLVRNGVKIHLRFKQKTTGNRSTSVLDERDTRDSKVALGGTMRVPIGYGLDGSVSASGAFTFRNDDTETETLLKQEKRHGINQRITFGVRSSDPQAAVTTALTATLSRNNASIRSQQDGGPEEVKDDNRDDQSRIEGRFTATPSGLFDLSLSTNAEKNEKNFLVQTGDNAGKVESHVHKKSRANMNLKGRFSKKLGFRSTVGYSWGSERRAVDVGQNKDLLNINGDMILDYKLPFRMKSQLTMKRSRIADDRFPGAGEPDPSSLTNRGEFLVNLSRPLWADTQIKTSGSLIMARRTYADTTRDKDSFDRRASFELTNQPAQAKLNGSAQISFHEAEEINIHRSKSGQNQTRQTWTLQPMMAWKPLKGLTIRNTYNVRLVYVFYAFNETRNSMSRVSNFTSTLRWSSFSRNASLTMIYKYKRDENGSFTGSGTIRNFQKDGEKSQQRLALKVDYRPGGGLTFTSEQILDAQRNFEIEEAKELTKHENSLRMIHSAAYTRTLPKDSKLTVNAKQNSSVTVPIFPASSNTGRNTESDYWEVRTSYSIAF